MPTIPAGPGGAAPPTLSVTLDDVKAHLNDSGTWSDAKQTEIQHFLDAAVAYVSRYLGLAQRDGSAALLFDTFTDTVTVTGGTLLIPRYPVVSVTSVAGIVNTSTNSLSYVTGDLLVDTIGRVVLGSGAYWALGRYAVTYTAGYETIPDDMRFAVLELVRVNYTETQHGGRPIGDPGEGGPRLGFYAPGRVTNLLGQFRPPVVA